MKRAIITGGQSGLGAACADRLRADGVEVVTFDVSADADFAVDVTDLSAVDAAVAAVGPVDILVNSAGIVGPNKPLWETSPAEWTRTFDVNVHGTFRMIRAVVPGHGRAWLGPHRQHREHGRQGRQSEPQRVLRVEGGSHRADEVARQGAREDRGARERDSPRRNRHAR